MATTEVVIMVEVVAVVKEEVKLQVRNINLRAIPSVIIAKKKNTSTRKLTIGPNKRMSKSMLTSAKKPQEESYLFMAQSITNDSMDEVWFIDSVCSNHMSGNKLLFRELDKTQKFEVRLGDNKMIEVEGKGTIAIKTPLGNTKILSDVQYAPCLTHNLLSVGQFMIGGYSILFDNDSCRIEDKSIRAENHKCSNDPK